MLFDYRNIDLDRVGHKKIEDRTIIEYDRFIFSIICALYPYHKKYIVHGVLDYADDNTGMIETIYLEDKHFKVLDYDDVKKYIEFWYIMANDLKILKEAIKKTNNGKFKIDSKRK